MKKIFCVFSILLFCASGVSAQKLQSGSLSVLKNQEVVNFVCDFSNCMIDGQHARVKMDAEKNWNKGVKEIIARFNQGQREANRLDQHYGNFPDAPYTITYVLSDIDDDQDCTGILIVSETQSGREVARIVKAKGNAGMFGTFFNLLGDAFHNLGEKFGKMISKAK